MERKCRTTWTLVEVSLGSKVQLEECHARVGASPLTAGIVAEPRNYRNRRAEPGAQQLDGVTRHPGIGFTSRSWPGQCVALGIKGDARQV